MTEQPPFVCAEEGSVELLEFSWPLPQDLDIDQEPETCLAYAVMRRPNGFLLCVPSGFFREGDLLAAQTAEDDALLGPSVELLVPPVALTDAGEWARADDHGRGPRLEGLGCNFSGRPHRLGRQALPPGQARHLPFGLGGRQEKPAENLGGLRSGYQTAVSEPPARAVKAPVRAKKPTVALLAAQQESFAKALAGISAQLAQITSTSSAPGLGPRAPGPATKGRHFCTSVGPHCWQGSAPRFSSKGSGFLVGPTSSRKGCLCPSYSRCGRRPTNLGRPGARRHGHRPWSGRGGHATAEPGLSSARVSDRPELRPPRRVWISSLFAFDSWDQLPPAHASRARTQGGSLCHQDEDRCCEENRSGHGRGSPASGRPDDKVPREVRWLSRPAARRAAPVAAGPNLGPPCGRLPPGRCGPRLASHDHARASVRRPGTARAGLALYSAARPPCKPLCKPPDHAHRCPPALCSSRGLQAHCLHYGFHEGARHSVDKEAGADRPKDQALRTCASYRGRRWWASRAAFDKEAAESPGLGSRQEGQPTLTATQLNSFGPGPSPLSLCACGVSTEGAGLYITACSACGNSAHLIREGRSSVHSSFQRRGSFPVSAGTGAPDRSVPAPDKPSFSTTTDFWSWAAALPRLLLATGTAFARFLAGTLHLPRDDSSPSTALFPLPAPRPGCFDKDVPEHGNARRQLLLDRVLHVTVAALNFLRANFRPVPSHCLQKPPLLVSGCCL